jgi:uncharacterized protein YaiI (UPF0178 family)
VRWIVDGLNVIGSRPDGWWRDREGAKRKLVEELRDLAEREPVTVVFDGRPFEVDAGPVEVRFASRSGPDAADDDIAALAGEGDTVVTSDARLAERSRAAGAAVVGAGEFRRERL